MWGTGKMGDAGKMGANLEKMSVLPQGASPYTGSLSLHRTLVPCTPVLRRAQGTAGQRNGPRPPVTLPAPCGEAGTAGVRLSHMRHADCRVPKAAAWWC